MRRSEWISWLVVSGAYVLTMVACDNQGSKPLDVPDRITVYPDVTACMADRKPQLLCATAMSSATKTHFDRAKRFADAASCAQIVAADACVLHVPPRGAEYYTPLMAGFVLGSALGVDQAVPVYYDRQGYARITGGDYRLGKRCGEGVSENCSDNGGSGGGMNSGSYISRDKTAIDTSSGNLRTVSRGGFGQSVFGASS